MIRHSQAWILTILFLFAVPSVHAQEAETDTVAKKAISELAFITGDWSGSGWMMGRDGQKHAFEQTEKISFKLDSTAILIEGMGQAEGKTIHNALAIVTYNKADGKFNFRSYLASGRSGDYDAELIDGGFHWYPNENMRYIIRLNEKGQWYEKGEMKRGDDWFQFFEMTLDKDQDHSK